MAVQQHAVAAAVGQAVRRTWSTLCDETPEYADLRNEATRVPKSPEAGATAVRKTFPVHDFD